MIYPYEPSLPTGYLMSSVEIQLAVAWFYWSLHQAFLRDDCVEVRESKVQ